MTLVSHARKFIFLKTHKTASTTVEMMLEPFCAPPGHVVEERTPPRIHAEGIIGARKTPREERRPLDKSLRVWRNHMAAAEVRRHVGPEVWAAYPKIISVRNPFDRLVSEFHWRFRDEDVVHGSFDGIRAAFLDFVRSGDWNTDEEVVTIAGAFVADHAVRFERLRDDLLDLGRTLGLELDLSALPVTKSTAGTRKSYAVADYFDADTIAIVRERMAWVFDHYDYPASPKDADQSAACATQGAPS